jgi:alpha-L-rhamnosidase
MMDAPFITAKTPIQCPVLRKSFTLRGGVKTARLSITGLGLYRAFVNNKRVGNDYLTPGFNDYDAYLRYQTYDISAMAETDTTIEVYLGDGWYKGRFGLNEHSGNIWGSKYLLAAEISIIAEDGSSTVIKTDETWTAAASFIRETSIYDGEFQDRTVDSTQSIECEIVKTHYNVIPYTGVPMVEKHLLKPELYISPKGEQILDFKQNMAGVCRFVCGVPKGAAVTLRFGETLLDGCFYNDNYRSAKSEFVYISDGNARLVEPYFTYYGFRYVKVEGIETVNPDDFSGVVIYSDLSETLRVETSAPKINRLIQNAVWGQRGNFLDIPTDCPQRDERLGWTGDTQVFSGTACYHMNCLLFYAKFLDDLRADQIMYYKGNIPMYSPSLKGTPKSGGAVWADAATIVSWNIYMHYGDQEQLRKNYPLMHDYVETLIASDTRDNTGHLLSKDFTFGDWVALDGTTPMSSMGGTDATFIRSVYYYNSVSICGRAASVLKFQDDAGRYAVLAEQIKTAILKEFFTESGRLGLETQTSYVLSLYYGIHKNREKVIEGFKARLAKDLYRIKTGFTGTSLMLPALMDAGMVNDAYRILFNETFPGWLYTVNLGATTIWERWNSLLPNGRVSSTGMNSLNHYSAGSVCEAIYSRIAGLRCVAPGWKEAVIAPQPNYRLKRISLEFDSPCGTYKTAWEICADNSFEMHVTIPAGARAVIIRPRHPEQERIEVYGGSYQYRYTPVSNFLYPFSKKTPVLDLLVNDAAREIIMQKLPRIYKWVGGDNEEFSSFPLEVLPGLVEEFGASVETVEEADALLKTIAG